MHSVMHLAIRLRKTYWNAWIKCRGYSPLCINLPMVSHSPSLPADTLGGMGRKWPLMIASLSWRGRNWWISWSHLPQRWQFKWHSQHRTTACLCAHLEHCWACATANCDFSTVLKSSARESFQLWFRVACLSSQFCILTGAFSSHLVKRSLVY